MIDAELVRSDPKKIVEAAKNKGYEIDLKDLQSLMDKTRELQTKTEALRARRNQLNDKLAKGQNEQTLKEAGQLKDQLGKLETELKEFAPKLKVELYKLPNLPASDVKVGKDETDNDIVRKVGEPPKFDFDPKDHLHLGEKLDLIDMERATKVSGARFAYLKNEAVLLEFGLVQLALKTLIKEGFVPVVPPVLINQSITEGLGYWHGGGNEDYYLVNEPNTEDKGFYLVGTAEHSLVPMHKDEILDLSKPKRYVGFSSSFRREAGTYGKDTRGILRVHQFDKVEMVSFVKSVDDDKEHEFLLGLEEKLFQDLGLPYQVVKMCTGDLGFPIARKYDIEAWLPGQNKYREVTSASTATDFQARRLNIRYREGEKTQFAHILNGTAFAIGRTIIAILENYQQKDGSIRVPEVLVPYVGLDKIG
jgi:seryl-tRNA synthetase